MEGDRRGEEEMTVRLAEGQRTEGVRGNVKVKVLCVVSHPDR